MQSSSVTIGVRGKLNNKTEALVSGDGQTDGEILHRLPPPALALRRISWGFYRLILLMVFSLPFPLHLPPPPLSVM